MTREAFDFLSLEQFHKAGFTSTCQSCESVLSPTIGRRHFSSRSGRTNVNEVAMRLLNRSADDF